jgi:hypothetical protein
MRLMRALRVAVGCAATLQAQSQTPSPSQTPAADDPIRSLVSRLDLDKYKATIKGLTQFGDRRQGTQRNRDAVNWIQKQLESYGYTNAERIASGRGAGAGMQAAEPASVVFSVPHRGRAPAAGVRVANARCRHRQRQGRRRHRRQSRPDGRQLRSDGPTDERIARWTRDRSPVRGRGPRHQGRLKSFPTRVHRRCAHGRPWLQRSRQ